MTRYRVSQLSVLVAILLSTFCATISADDITGCVETDYRTWMSKLGESRVRARLIGIDDQRGTVALEFNANSGEPETITVSIKKFAKSDQFYVDRIRQRFLKEKAEAEGAEARELAAKNAAAAKLADVLSLAEVMKAMREYERASEGMNELKAQNARKKLSAQLQDYTGRRLEIGSAISFVKVGDNDRTFVYPFSNFSSTITKGKEPARLVNSPPAICVYLASKPLYCNRQWVCNEDSGKLAIACSWKVIADGHVLDPMSWRHPVSFEVGREISSDVTADLTVRHDRVTYQGTIVEAVLQERSETIICALRQTSQNRVRLYQKRGGPTLLITLDDVRIVQMNGEPFVGPAENEELKDERALLLEKIAK